MIETGTGNAAYYADILHAVVTLAVTAPPGPPASATGFLERLDEHWLTAAWDDGQHPAEAARVRAAARHIGDIQLRYTTLLGRLGRAFDGPGQLWPTPTPGTSSWKAPANPPSPKPRPWPSPNWPPAPPPARHGPQRAILLAADDYSAVSRRVPLSNLYERGRSLGIGVQVSAQTWQGLGRDDDERYRIAATADGGLWVMHTPYPEPLCELAGARRVLETAHKLIGSSWGDEGTTRLQHAWTADPDLIRRMAHRAGLLHLPRLGHLRAGRPAPPVPAHPAARTRPRRSLPTRPPAPGRQAPAPPPGQPSARFDDHFGPGATP